MSDEAGPATGQTDQPATGPNDQPATGNPTALPATGNEQPDLAAEVERYRSEARKWEDRSKANAGAARELDALRRQSMSDTERAVAEAVSAARAEMASTYGGRLVEAQVRAAAAGRPVDAEALLDGLDRKRFLGDDGEPDTKAIAAWLDKVAPRSAEPVPLDLGQGQRPAGPTGADMNARLRHAAGRT
jgi:hypothetical protein